MKHQISTTEYQPIRNRNRWSLILSGTICKEGNYHWKKMSPGQKSKTKLLRLYDKKSQTFNVAKNFKIKDRLHLIRFQFLKFTVEQRQHLQTTRHKLMSVKAPSNIYNEGCNLFRKITPSKVFDRVPYLPPTKCSAEKRCSWIFIKFKVAKI